MVEATTTVQTPTGNAAATGGNGKGRKKVGRPAIAPSESKADKFTRLALARMPHFKQRARMIANLAAYEYTEAQKARLLTEVRKVCADIESAFTASRRDDSFTF